MERFTLSDISVIAERADRGAGALTGGRFCSAADTGFWTIPKGYGFLRDARDLTLAHWLLDQERERPEGFTCSRMTAVP